MVKKKEKILMVEDDRVDQMAFERFVHMGQFPYNYCLASSLKEAKTMLANEHFDAIVSDYFLGDGDAFDLFVEAKGTPIILITGAGNEEIAVKAMKEGAYDYLIKDPDSRYLNILSVALKNTIKRKQDEEELKHYRERLEKLVENRTCQLQREVNERKAAEQAVKKSNDRLRSLLEALPDHVYIITETGEVIQVLGNEKTEKEFQRDLFPQKGLEELMNTVRKTIRTGKLQTLEYSVTGAEGTRCFEGRTTFLQTPINQQTAVVWVARDITDRKQEEEERHRLATAVDQATEAIVIADAKGVIQYVNPALEQSTGYSREEIIGQKPSLWKSGKHDLSFYENLWNTITKGSVWKGHIVNKKKNGILYEEETSISPIRDEAGIITNYVAVKKDITHEKELEEQLRQSQKMEAIGTLAGGIAHDFNNILQGIFMSLQLLEMKLPKDSPAKKRLENIFNFSKRAANLVKQILTLSRRTDKKFTTLQIAPLVKEVLNMVRSTLPTTITIHQNISKACGNISGNLTQIHQVILNICTNAGYAMQETGGELNVTLDEVSLDAKKAEILGLKGVKYLRLTIADTGTGMTPEVQEHIFEPFFTTKPNGEGTGLGLSVAHGIVREHEGNIIVKSELGLGTTFEVFFPAIRGEAEPVREEKLQLPGGSEKILVVDDEEVMVELVKQTLEHLGYNVTVVSNGKMALEIIRAVPDQFDLILTDQTMPRMTGEQLAQTLVHEVPNIPVILTTGYSHQINKEKIEEIGIQELIMKPFDMDQVSKTIRKVLDKKK